MLAGLLVLLATSAPLAEYVAGKDTDAREAGGHGTAPPVMDRNTPH